MRNKIKYQGAITKILCQKLSDSRKKSFRSDVAKIDVPYLSKSQQINFDVISLSGDAGFEDQVLSIYSFVVYAGIPNQWTIYSDKSYTNEQKKILTEKFPFVVIKDWDIYSCVFDNDLFKNYHEQGYSMAKKLNIILGHQYDRQTLYLDSDIIFYKNMSYYINSGLLDTGLWYAPDAIGEISNYFSKKEKHIFPLNAGLLILNAAFDQSDIVEYFEKLKGNYHYFSEQSSFEYAFRKQNAKMLDPRQFVIDTSDQFDFSTKYYPDSIAMRHYTTPVRHKIWQNGWKWHLGE